jgi:hypothetical protein
MSIFVLLVDQLKSWLNIRVNNIAIDGTMSVAGTSTFGSIDAASIQTDSLTLATGSTALTYYESTSFSTPVTGCISTTATVKITKVGSLVTLSCTPDINPATFTATTWKLESIPSRFMPASGSLYYFYTSGINNNVNVPCAGYIGSSAIIIGKSTNGAPDNFGAFANSIVGGFTVSFSL